MLRDIRRQDEDVLAVRDALLAHPPDILLLLDFDHDLEGRALGAFADLMDAAGHPMPHHYAPRPNSGMATGLDMDGDGRRGGPGDAQGWGRFAGAGGMALLSRYPLSLDGATDHTDLLWRDLPRAALPVAPDGSPFPSVEARNRQRLAAVSAWEVVVSTPGDHPLRVMAWHATPPVFDGPEGRNRLRNADETAFWRLRLDGQVGGPVPDAPFVLMGNANLDPDAGDGDRAVMRALLAHPLLQDPRPAGAHPDPDAAPTATAWWPDGPGALRVDYLLPSSDLTVRNSGLHWMPDATHALVWVDLLWPP